MSASLAWQTAARTMLLADPALIALVPADSIFDSNNRPEISPKVVLGEDQELPGDDVVGRYTKLYSNFHVWVKEDGTRGTKTIASALRRILCAQPTVWNQDGYTGIDTRLVSARYIRDPDGETTHGIVTFQVTIQGD